MTSLWLQPIEMYHLSFTRGMDVLLTEALMAPVLIWLAWGALQRTTRMRGTA